MRTFLIFLALGTVALAEGQVDWVGDWDEAFLSAKRTGKPIMVCINSKDGERANEATAHRIYRDRAFVKQSRKFVMVLVSTLSHTGAGPCRRFGKITCAEHLGCWHGLRTSYSEKFLQAGGNVISPQHAWFKPDGTLLERREYFLERSGLVKRMKSALAAVNSAGPVKLDKEQQAELDKLAAADDPYTRAEALQKLLAADTAGVHRALGKLLATTKNEELQGAMLRALSRAQVESVRPTAEKLLAHEYPDVRAGAAVALEELGSKESVKALLKRAKGEPDTDVRRDMYRALGKCGGPAASKPAARALIKAMKSDKQTAVRRHAAFAMSGFAGSGAALVRKELEAAAADAEIQRAIVYALAHVGDEKATVPVLKKILEQEREDWARRLIEAAIAGLTAEGGSSEETFTDAAARICWEDKQDPARNG